MKQIDFGQIADFRNGLNFSKSSHGRGSLMIGIPDFRDRMTPDTNLLEEINVSGIAGDEDYVKKGDILFVRSNGNKNLVGRSLFIDKDMEAVFSGFCIRARLNSTLFNSKFCFYFTRTNTFRSFISTSGGTSIQNLNQVILGSVKLPLLSIKEQNKIVKVLSDLDTKIDINNRINVELEALARLIFDYWFMQFDFPNTKGKPYKASGGKMVWNEEMKRDIPNNSDWKVGTLLDIADFYNGLPCQKFRPTNENFLRVIKIREMNEGFTDSSEFVRPTIPEKSIINNGDVLFSWSASLDVKIWSGGKGALNQHIFKVTSGQYPVSFYYFQLRNYLNHFKMMAENRKTTMGHITQDHLIQSRIVIPPNDLVKQLDNVISPLLKKKVANEVENQKLIELRDWLLPMLINGQVQINDGVANKVVKQSVNDVPFKPTNTYFYQTQVVAAIVNASKQNKISHGEMTLAKYSYLLDKVYKVPTLFNYDRWHLGPYPKEMKKVVLNKKFFKIQNNEVTVVAQKKEYDFQFQKQVEDAVKELASIFNQYKGKERSFQTELLATVCKVVEDIQSTDLKAVRESMKKWPIKLDTTKFKNKAQKFEESATKSALNFIISKGWVKVLLGKV